MPNLVEHARRVPVGGWIAALVVSALVLLVWHDWMMHAPDDEEWLDPHQPALQLDSPTAHIPALRPDKTYPDTLAAWGSCVVGDC